MRERNTKIVRRKTINQRKTDKSKGTEAPDRHLLYTHNNFNSCYQRRMAPRSRKCKELSQNQSPEKTIGKQQKETHMERDPHIK